LLAADLVLVPAQPSPFDGWASGEALKLIAEARNFRPALVARFALNRCAARTRLADRPTGRLRRRRAQRSAGRLVGEVDENSPAAREIVALSADIERIAL
jgi:chromosome partitioning protein